MHPRPVAVTAALPHMARIARGTALLLATLMTVTALLAVASPARAAGGDGLRQAANAYRQSRHLRPVAGTAVLDGIATRRAAQMAQANRLEHDMDYVARRLNSAGVCWSGVGEIIAWERGYPDYDYGRTVRQWWDSPPHHDIMMGQGYNAAGGGWRTAADGGHYSVMVFVTLCGDSVASPSAGVLYPDDRYRPNRELVLRARRVTAYRLGRSGAVLARKSVTLSKVTRAASNGRARANGRAWLKVSTGALAGHWVHETDATFVRGLTEKRLFTAERQVALAPGRHVGQAFDRLGRVRASHGAFFHGGRTFRTSALGVINGRRYFLLGSGPLDGFWVRDTPAVRPL